MSSSETATCRDIRHLGCLAEESETGENVENSNGEPSKNRTESLFLQEYIIAKNSPCKGDISFDTV